MLFISRYETKRDKAASCNGQDDWDTPSTWNDKDETYEPAIPPINGWGYFTEISLIVLFTCVLVMGFYNIGAFLIIEKRYKQLPLTLFYVFA